MLKIIELQFNYRSCLSFVDISPVCTWRVESSRDENRQESFRIIYKTESGVVFDSGEVYSREQRFAPTLDLLPYTKYICHLEIKDIYGESASIENTFETGKIDDNWRADWICSNREKDDDSVAPVYIFKKAFQTKGKVQKARLYASALGCYAITINGKSVSERYFAPGFTQYTDRVQYQSYDITDLISDETIVFAELAGGWYTGRLGITLKGNRYGNKRAFIAEIHLYYEDGTEQIIGTDKSWVYTEDGPRRSASFFDGETYEAERENFSLWHFQNAAIFSGHIPSIEADGGVPVTEHQKLFPINIEKTKDGVLVTFERNIAGIIELVNIKTDKHQKIIVEHSEILKDGQIYTGNLRTAKAKLVYFGKGGIQSYKPKFTYMGFRYVHIKGVEISQENICAIELYSDNELTSEFNCSAELLNKLHENILTSQKANFVDIPTDCPQRDERSGWTGDIAVFAPTACFNMNINAFMDKWLKDVRCNQTHRGIVPMFVPDNGFGHHKKDGIFSLIHKFNDAVWGDSIVLVPYAIYRSTGDIGILQENYVAMKKWVKYEEEQSAKFSCGAKKYIWSWGFHFGDWLAPNEGVLKNMRKGNKTATAYFAHTCFLMSEIADLLGKEVDKYYYTKLFNKIKQSFRKIFLNKNGEIKKGFQTIYSLAISFDLLDQNEQQINGKLLNEDIINHDYHITTGFVGTPYILYALCRTGYNDTAFKLLLQEKCPSWLYSIKCGATSIWERWDALKEDGSVNISRVGKDCMVSFNHYAYGSIGSWLYEKIGGIQAEEAGYASIKIDPLIGYGITYCRCRHRSPYGDIECEWMKNSENVSLCVTIPFGSKATVMLPNGETKQVFSGKYMFNLQGENL